ncbi:MAG TPA: hypothetical protein DIT09_10075 [Glutamicibacter sp.]|nr:hypothetical protein [Glutamicibacter sp.]
MGLGYRAGCVHLADDPHADGHVLREEMEPVLMPKLQPPSETRARALEDAADAFSCLQDAPLIAWDGLVNVAQVQEQADDALEDPAEWLRAQARKIRENQA